MKALFILAIVLGVLSFAYIVMTATPNDQKEYNRYMSWKERKKKRKEIEHLCEMAERLEKADHE